MTEKIRKLLALVVDDDDELREEHNPDKAATVGPSLPQGEGCAGGLRDGREAWSGKRDPVDIVVLDMQMPRSPRHALPEKNAGVDTLNIYAKLGLVKEQCRVIVFTAYPSYENCANSVKAGAYAYIPKLEQTDGSGGGLDELIGVCRNLLLDTQQATSTEPDHDEWLRRTSRGCEKFGGQWVALVDGKIAEKLP